MMPQLPPQLLQALTQQQQQGGGQRLPPEILQALMVQSGQGGGMPPGGPMMGPTGPQMPPMGPSGPQMGGGPPPELLALLSQQQGPQTPPMGPNGMDPAELMMAMQQMGPSAGMRSSRFLPDEELAPFLPEEGEAMMLLEQIMQMLQSRR